MGQTNIGPNEMISVVVTVAPRLKTVSSCEMVVMAIEIDSGKVVTKVVSAPVTVVNCGGTVSVAVEMMGGTATVAVAAGIVIRTVEAGLVIVVKDPESEVVIVKPEIVNSTTEKSN